MERYSAILTRGDFAAVPILLARALGIAVAPGASVVKLNSPAEAYALGDKSTGRANTRNFIFYRLGDWTVLGDWNFDFTDDHYAVAGSAVLDTEIISLQGVEDGGFGFTYAKSGNLVRSILGGSGTLRQKGAPLPEEPSGAPSTWGFEAPLEIGAAMGAPDVYAEMTVPCYALELELYEE